MSPHDRLMKAREQVGHGTRAADSTFAPDRYEQLVAALQPLLSDVDDEIEQRKHGGLDEDWKPLQQLVDNVRNLLP